MRFFAIALAVLLIPFAASAADTPPTAETPVRVLLVTGGHGFETNEFLAMFEANPHIRLTHAVYPEAQAWFAPDRSSAYDVLVLYDMWPEITAQSQSHLLQLIDSGKGLLAMHHCLASFPAWDDYPRLIGGKYHLNPWVQNGREQPASTYQHDVDFTVQIVDPHHPVTRGVQDFSIHDETYGGFEVRPEVLPLLRTDAPTSGPVIAWTRTQGQGRVVYLQLGHDHLAYDNPSFRQIVAQAIAWVAKPR